MEKEPPKNLITKEMYKLAPTSNFEFTKDDRKYVVNILEMLDTLKDPEYMIFEEGNVTLLAKEKK